MRKSLNLLGLFWALFFFFSGMAVFWVSGQVIRAYMENSVPGDIEKGVPYYEEVKKIIEPLRYSGFDSLMLPDVSLSIDFDRKKWTLHNIHHFDKNGKVALTQGKYGVCGELAAYVYDKIRPIFPRQYEIKYVSLSESGYFLHPRASHLGLVISRRTLLGSEAYLLDPSFHNYGRANHFDEYAFFDETAELDFVRTQDPDQAFDISSIAPMRIKKDFLIGLVVDETGGKFDRNNFLLAVTATKRFKYAGRYIIAFRRIEGKLEAFENKRLALNIITQDTYDKLKERVQRFYAQIP